MLTARMEEELNRQLNRELQAAYLYLSMSAYAETLNLDGFAHWLSVQAREEVGHGMRIYRFLADRDARIKLLQLQAPQDNFSSLLEVFEAALHHEQELAQELERISRLSYEERDNTTQTFLNWFLTEQVEEIAITSELRDKLKLAGNSGNGLLILNEELKMRPDPSPKD